MNFDNWIRNLTKDLQDKVEHEETPQEIKDDCSYT